MSRFTEAEYVMTHSNAAGGLLEYELVTDMVYEIDHLGSGWKISIPAGFKTDLTSVRPWMLRTYLGVYVFIRLARASIVHDFVRKDKKKSKFLGDYIFWEAMGVDKVPTLLRVLAFIVVLCNFNRN